MTTTTGRSTRGRSTPAATAAADGALGQGSGDGPSRGRNVEAAERFLGSLPTELSGSPLGALLVTLAVELDEPNSATSKSMNATVLRTVYADLRELMPAKREVTRLDGIAADRTKRRGRQARAAH